MKYIFVSSTFKDMQQERDMLHTYLEPIIDQKLSVYGQEITFGDLRWGVNTTSLDDLESSKKVLDVCLDEIDHCRPYMIVLIGERYGWIPDMELIKGVAEKKNMKIFDEMSVTELEIEYGAFFNRDLGKRVLFYFRNLDKSTMSKEELVDFEAESSVHFEKLEKLKKKIIETYPNQVRYYNALWDRDSKKIVGLESLMKLIEDDLEQLLKEDILKDEALTWQEKSIKNAHEYLLEKSYNYFPVTTLPITELDGAYADTLTLMNWIEGDSLTGKTSFLANQYLKAINEEKDSVIIPFVKELDHYSLSTLNFFKVLLYKLEEELGVEHYNSQYQKEDSTELIEVENLIKDYLNQTKKQFICFIDDADELLHNILYELFYDHFDNDLEDELSERELFNNLLFYITFKSDENKILLPPNYLFSKTYQMYAIGDEDKTDFIKTIIKDKHKELSNKVINEIIKKEDSDLVIYVKLVVDRLLMFNADDFKAIRSLGDGMDNINKYMIQVVKNIGDYTNDAVKELISSLCKIVNQDFVMRICGVLVYSSIGVSEDEIKEIFDKCKWEFNTLDFKVVMKNLGTIIDYRKFFNNYKITNKEMIKPIIELLEENGYHYVCDEVFNYFVDLPTGSVYENYLLRIASYKNDYELLERLFISFYQKNKNIERELKWLKDYLGEEQTATFLANVVKNNLDINFTNLLITLPTTNLLDQEYDNTMLFLDELRVNLPFIEKYKHEVNYNSFVMLVLSKIIQLECLNKSSYSAYGYWVKYVNDYIDYQIYEKISAIMWLVYTQVTVDLYNAKENKKPYPYLIDELGLREDDLYESKIIKGHLLYYYTKTLYLKDDYDKYISLAVSYYDEVFEDKDFCEELLTVMDYEIIIKAYLNNMVPLIVKDDNYDEAYRRLYQAMNYLQMGFTKYNSRMSKLLSTIFEQKLLVEEMFEEEASIFSTIVPHLRENIHYKTNDDKDLFDVIDSYINYLITYEHDDDEENDIVYRTYIKVKLFLKEFNVLSVANFNNLFLKLIRFLNYLYQTGRVTAINELLFIFEEIDGTNGVNEEIFNLFKSFILVYYDEDSSDIDKKAFIKLFKQHKKHKDLEYVNKLYHLEIEYIDHAVKNEDFKEE